MTPRKDPAYPSQRLQDPDKPPELAEDPNTDFDVQAVIDVMVDDKDKWWFLVEWAGYGDEHNSWEPAESLLTAAAKVREFYRNQRQARRPPLELARKFKLRGIYAGIDLHSNSDRDARH